MHTKPYNDSKRGYPVSPSPVFDRSVSARLVLVFVSAADLSVLVSQYSDTSADCAAESLYELKLPNSRSVEYLNMCTRLDFFSLSIFGRPVWRLMSSKSAMPSPLPE